MNTFDNRSLFFPFGMKGDLRAFQESKVVPFLGIQL